MDRRIYLDQGADLICSFLCNYGLKISVLFIFEVKSHLVSLLFAK